MKSGGNHAVSEDGKICGKLCGKLRKNPEIMRPSFKSKVFWPWKEKNLEKYEPPLFGEKREMPLTLSFERISTKKLWNQTNFSKNEKLPFEKSDNAKFPSLDRIAGLKVWVSYKVTKSNGNSWNLHL